MQRKVYNNTSIWRTSFHPIQVLLVITFLGLIAAVVTYNALGLLGAARLNAANAEVNTVRTTALNYIAEYRKWPTDDAELSSYHHGTINGKYVFDTTTGFINEATGWDGLTFDYSLQMWKKE
jgi:hypothetical protein